MHGTFDLLGFTHDWARSRQGNWVIERSRAQNRFRRTRKRIAAWCRRHRHERLARQAQGLSQKLRGHVGYFGIRGHAQALAHLHDQVVTIGRTWLDRRSQKAKVTWWRLALILRQHPLPFARLPAGRASRTHAPKSRMPPWGMSGSGGAPGGNPRGDPIYRLPQGP